MKYLYGAAVQGIQSFIFQTNKLKEIVGASELVEQVCTEAFTEYASNGEMIISAAGNIKFIFNDRKDCERAVREFPKKVLTMAPGITLSQAVVELNGDYANKRNELETKLHEARNRQVISTPVGFMGVMRSRQTGLPIVAKSANQDDATIKKLEWTDPAKSRLHEKLFKGKYNVKNRMYDTEHLSKNNNWIAVVHVDGNGLGDIVREYGDDLDKLKTFSKNLSDATEKSASEAVRAVATSDTVPIIPVIIGGDDLTVIIRGDLAVDYVEAYLQAFERNTESICGKRLTACGGIAFIKSSYPFYYGCELAESLCGKAKNLSGRKKSCLMFHKVQDSFVTSYNDITERELTLPNGGSFVYGPYYLEQTNGASIGVLKEYVTMLNKDELGSAAKTHLRQWLSLMHKSDKEALQRLNRVKSQTFHEGLLRLIETATSMSNNDRSYAAYDILELSTVIYQKTR